MISGLLWRCPICKTNDSISHHHRFLQADKVRCDHCESVWELQRVKGGTDYLLKAVAGSMAGSKQPLAEWYDMMRAGFSLIPIPAEKLNLDKGEELYLQGSSENLMVLQTDPRFSGAIAALPIDPSPNIKNDKNPAMAHLGPVNLALTNRRFILSHNNVEYGLALSSIRGIEILLDRLLIIRHEGRLIEILVFNRESPLKWRAYFDAVLQPIAEASGIRIRMPYD
jgi:predicted Zn finger-like uncharacterized protein